MAVHHLAERRRLDGRGHLGVDRLHRRENRHPDLRRTQGMRQVDRVLQDVGLFLQRGGDVDRGVGDDQAVFAARHVHHEAMADAARGAQPGLAPHHRGHELVGVQAALHERLGLALAHPLHGCCRGRLAVGCVDDRHGREIDAACGGDGLDPLARAEENRRDQSKPRSLNSPLQRTLVAGMRHGRRRRRQCLAVVDQPLVFRVSCFHVAPVSRGDECNAARPGAPSPRDGARASA